MKNLPQDYLNIIYYNYPDGIISGLEIRKQDQAIVLTPGLAKYNGKYYRFLDKNRCDLCFDLSAYLKSLVATEKIKRQTKYTLCFIEPDEVAKNKLVVDKEKFSEPLRQECLQQRVLLMKFVEGEKLGTGLPLLEFRLDANENLELNNDNFDKLFNLYCCPYAIDSATTFHPYVFAKLAEVVRKKEKRTYFDYSILNTLAIHKVMNLEALCNYAGVEYDGCINEKLFNNLKKSLETIVPKFPVPDTVETLPETPKEKKGVYLG